MTEEQLKRKAWKLYEALYIELMHEEGAFIKAMSFKYHGGIGYNPDDWNESEKIKFDALEKVTKIVGDKALLKFNELQRYKNGQ